MFPTNMHPMKNDPHQESCMLNYSYHLNIQDKANVTSIPK